MESGKTRRKNGDSSRRVERLLEGDERMEEERRVVDR